MRRTIPDLRNDHEISLEHCFVLVECLEKIFNDLEGESMFADLAYDLDPSLMKNYFEQLFDPQSFTRLFHTEMGKGVLVGAFAQALMDQMADDLEGLEDEV